MDYGYQGAGLIWLTGRIEPECVSIRIEDMACAFDPRTHDHHAKLAVAPAEREAGGFGLFLALRKLDGFCYEYADGKNRNTLIDERTMGTQMAKSTALIVGDQAGITRELSGRPAAVRIRDRHVDREGDGRPARARNPARHAARVGRVRPAADRPARRTPGEGRTTANHHRLPEDGDVATLETLRRSRVRLHHAAVRPRPASHPAHHLLRAGAGSPWRSRRCPPRRACTPTSATSPSVTRSSSLVSCLTGCRKPRAGRSTPGSGRPRSVAGDFYDAFELVGGRRIALVIGDVCDKGVGAALFMALNRTMLRHTAEQAGGWDMPGDGLPPLPGCRAWSAGR